MQKNVPQDKNCHILNVIYYCWGWEKQIPFLRQKKVDCFLIITLLRIENDQNNLIIEDNIMKINFCACAMFLVFM